MKKELITKETLFVQDPETKSMVLSENAIDTIIDIETKMTALNKEYKKYKQALLDGMESYGLKRFENDDLLVTYVEPTERCGIDQEKLWAEYKSVAFKCQKVSPVKSSVRVKVR